MSGKLQKFSYKDSPYSRPSQKWVCGNFRNGEPCKIGPDKKGNCRVEYECTPHKKGDRWSCTRTTFFGDKHICKEGPLSDGTCCNKITKCQPVRSIRHKRGLVAKWSFSLMIGIFAFFLASENRAWFFSPGELTFRHAQNTECSTCHIGFDEGVVGWVHRAISGTTSIDNNQQCINCHKLGINASKPHGVSENNLIALTKSRHEQRTLTETMACMTCHIEHHGAEFNLLAGSSQNCALCHESDFKNFQKVHPDFQGYPYRQRTKIIFDHAGHYAKHFYDKSGKKLLDLAPEECGSCHIVDSNGIKMKLRGFNETCSGCHNEQFEEAESFVALAVPELNIDDIVGNWPEDAESQISPMLALLLAGDSRFINSLSTLEEGADLIELSPEHTSDLAWAIKDFLYDLRADGREAVKKRLIKSFKCRVSDDGDLIEEPICKLTPEKVATFLALFPFQSVCEGQKQWFPNLKSEVSLYRDFIGAKYQRIRRGFCGSVLELDHADLIKGEWTLEGAGLEYLPTSHGDDFIKQLIDLTELSFPDNRIESLRLTSFEDMSNDDAPGQCNKCHSIDNLKMDQYKVNWMDADWDPERKDFVKFTHSQHLIHQDEKVCGTCHLLQEDADYLSSYEDGNPDTFKSNFTTTKNECGTCHESAMVKDQCLICHNYHVISLTKGEHTFKYKPVYELGQLKLWADNADYSIGDSMTLSFTVDKAMYVRIVFIDTAGRKITLFPNENQEDNFCRPGEVYQIPAKDSEQILEVTGPKGINKIIGVASAKKFGPNQLFFEKDGAFDDSKMTNLTIKASVELMIH